MSSSLLLLLLLLLLVLPLLTQWYFSFYYLSKRHVLHALYHKSCNSCSWASRSHTRRSLLFIAPVYLRFALQLQWWFLYSLLLSWIVQLLQLFLLLYGSVYSAGGVRTKPAWSIVSSFSYQSSCPHLPVSEKCYIPFPSFFMPSSSSSSPSSLYCCYYLYYCKWAFWCK